MHILFSLFPIRRSFYMFIFSSVVLFVRNKSLSITFFARPFTKKTTISMLLPTIQKKIEKRSYVHSFIGPFMR